MSAARRKLRTIGACSLVAPSCHISLGETCDADLNRDGQVNFTDQTILLADFGLSADDVQNCHLFTGRGNINLGPMSVHVDWVSIHLLHYGLAGIRFPDRTEFRVYNGSQQVLTDYVDTSELSCIYLPVTQHDSEWLLQNRCPWGVECTRIEISFETGWWTWIDEIEVIDDEFHPPSGFGCEYYHESHQACRACQ